MLISKMTIADFVFFYIQLQGRIKKIMQSDEEVGKVAQAVPIIIYILFKKLNKIDKNMPGGCAITFK